MHNSVAMGINRLKKFPSVYYTLFIILAINIAMNPRILTARGLNNLFLQIMPTILCSIGQACVMLVGELDMSVGSTISLTTVLLALTMKSMGGWSVLLVVGAILAIGLLNGFLTGFVKLPGMVATLTMQMMAGGLALLLMPVPGGFIDIGFGNLFTGKIWIVPNSAILLLLALLAWPVIKKNKVGTNLYATGGNYYSAFVSGIPVRAAKLIAFVLCAVFSMLAGFIIAAKAMSGDSDIGTRYTTLSIAGAVLGGVSFQGGAAVMGRVAAGAVVISVLANILFFMGISSYVQYIVQGAILIIAVVASLLNKKSGS